MLCDDFLTMLDEMRADSFSEPARNHLASCTRCAVAWRDWQALRAGFRAISTDAAPKAQFGFATRVLRRLDDAVVSGRSAAEFMEQIGRRFVLASFVTVLFLILSFSLPGPATTHGSSLEEPYLAQAEPTTRNDASLLGYESAEAPPAQDAGGNPNQK